MCNCTSCQADCTRRCICLTKLMVTVLIFISPWLCTCCPASVRVAVQICSAHSAKPVFFYLRTPGSGASLNGFQHSSAHSTGPMSVAPRLLRYHANNIWVVLPLRSAHSARPAFVVPPVPPVQSLLRTFCQASLFLFVFFCFCLTGGDADHNLAMHCQHLAACCPRPAVAFFILQAKPMLTQHNARSVLQHYPIIHLK